MAFSFKLPSFEVSTIEEIHYQVHEKFMLHGDQYPKTVATLQELDQWLDERKKQCPSSELLPERDYVKVWMDTKMKEEMKEERKKAQESCEILHKETDEMSLVEVIESIEKYMKHIIVLWLSHEDLSPAAMLVKNKGHRLIKLIKEKEKQISGIDLANLRDYLEYMDEDFHRNYNSESPAKQWKEVATNLVAAGKAVKEDDIRDVGSSFWETIRSIFPRLYYERQNYMNLIKILAVHLQELLNKWTFAKPVLEGRCSPPLEQAKQRELNIEMKNTDIGKLSPSSNLGD